MIHNIERDYNIPLRQQIRSGERNGWKYIGCFGSPGNAVLKFVEQ